MSWKPGLIIVLLLMVGLLASGCGAIATPPPPAPPTPQPFTLVPRLAQSNPAVIGGQPTATTPGPTSTEFPTTAAPTAIPPTTTATGAPSAAPTEALAAVGDPLRGQELFTTGKDAAPACTACHRVDQDTALIGPSLVGIASRAGERVEGQSAEDYLRLSIVEPNAYLVPNSTINVFAIGDMSQMFQQYGSYLTGEDIDNLVAYMLTLE
jgi:mono/diheme cytochrome c family protein